MIRRVPGTKLVQPQKASSSSSLYEFQQQRGIFHASPLLFATWQLPNDPRTNIHPLAVKSPSFRNISLPDSVHSKKGASTMKDPDHRAKKVEKAIMHQLAQKMLWKGAVVDRFDNPVVEHFTKLKTNGKYRRSRKKLILGGEKLMEELGERGYHPSYLMLGHRQALPAWINREKTEIVAVNENIMKKMSGKSSGFVGDFTIPEPPLIGEIISPVARMTSVLVLDNVIDEHVLGSSIRSAVAFGYDLVLLTNNCADYLSTEVVQAACGAHFQRNTTILPLRDEDGDDVQGMLNHLASTNKLTPVVYSSAFAYEEGWKTLKATEAAASAEASRGNTDKDDVSVAAVEERKPDEHLPATRLGEWKPRDTASLLNARGIKVQKLHDFCLESYSKSGIWFAEHQKMLAASDGNAQVAKAEEGQDDLEAEYGAASDEEQLEDEVSDKAASDEEEERKLQEELDEQRRRGVATRVLKAQGGGKPALRVPDRVPLAPGHMLIVGEDYKGTMTQRYVAQLAQKPTMLLSDCPELDEAGVELALPTMLYELRHSAAFDYLTSQQRDDGDYDVEMQDVQASRTPALKSKELDLDDDEYYNEVQNKLHRGKMDRLYRRTLGDKDYYMQQHASEIKNQWKAERNTMSRPIAAHFDPVFQDSVERTKNGAKMRQDIPDYIRDTDTQDVFDRDLLRDERDAFMDQMDENLKPTNYAGYKNINVGGGGPSRLFDHEPTEDQWRRGKVK